MCKSTTDTSTFVCKCITYTCTICGYSCPFPNEFVTLNDKDICLDCAGYAPPTCGSHGDY